MSPVTIKLGGKTRRLRYGLNAMIALGEAGVEMESIGPVLKKGGVEAMRLIRVLLWAALIDDDATLSPEDAGAMVEIQRMDEIIKAVVDALIQASPPEEKAKASKRPRKAQG